MKIVGKPFIALLVTLTIIVGPMAFVPLAAQEAPVVLDIAVRGNTHVDTETILDAFEHTKIGEPLDVQAANEDLLRIYDLGYFHDVVANVEALVGIRNGIRFVVEVFEFPVLKEVAVDAEGVAADVVRDWMKTRSGHVLNQKQLEKDIVTIQDRAVEDYGVYLRPTLVDLDEQTDTLALAFKAARVRDVQVTGHEKTKDHVVRREITVAPGDTLNRQQVQRTLQRLSLTGFFDDVGANFVETGDPDSLDLVFEVRERKTGMASFGAGYSNLDGFLGYIEVADENFLGRGQRANVRWEFGRNKNSYELGFHEPYLMGSKTSFGINLYNAAEENMHRKGGDITLGRPLGEFTRGSISYKTYDWTMMPTNERGQTRSVMLSATTDTRNHPFSPTAGFRSRLSVERGGGFLGGTDDFTKYEGQYSKYFKLGQKEKQAFALRAIAGHGHGPGGEPLAEQHRFGIGGADTLRGYGNREFVGDRKLVLNAELRLPLADAVEAALFADFGNAFAHDEPIRLRDLKAGYGVGLRLDTPLGIIRIDYGIGEEGGRAYFSLGPAF